MNHLGNAVLPGTRSTSGITLKAPILITSHGPVPAMNKSNTIVDNQQKEALVSMTALYFIEEHRLLDPEQLSDAKKSLQALFLRTSGEETMLRKLIDILKTTKQIHQSFASISSVLSGITRGVQTVDGKVAAYKQALATMTLSAEENAAFVGPFLS